MTDQNDAPEQTDADAPVKTLEKRNHTYEIIATVLLGVATVTIAWAANQSNLWSGTQDKRLAESVRVDNDSVDSFQNGDSTRLLDRMLFIELVDEVDESGELTPRGQEIVNNMSPGGTEVVNEWAAGAVDFPFDDEIYLDGLFGEGTELKAQADALYEEGVQANTNGDKYVLASTLMATVLFFAGISMVLVGTRTRQVLLAVATLALIGSTAYMLSLPIA